MRTILIAIAIVVLLINASDSQPLDDRALFSAAASPYAALADK